MTRQTFYYFPTEAATDAQTFLLDWNVASKLVSLFDGQRFERSPEIQARLQDLGDRFPDSGYAISGFAAAESEVRPGSTHQDSERMFHRAATAL